MNAHEEVTQEEQALPREGSILPALRDPEVTPAPTIEDLLAMEGEKGLIYAQQKETLLRIMREASIRMTHPEDWVLFKRREDESGPGRVTAYLSDAGCKRIKRFWGIEVVPCDGGAEFAKEKIIDKESGIFAFVVTGDGRCHATGDRIFAEEGVRRSDEDFVKGKKGIQLEIEVRKASFANLHGGITRSLTGLGNLPATYLDDVWLKEGKGKTTAHCAKGRGFGSQDARVGMADVDYGDAPTCQQKGCGRKMVLRPGKGDRGPFWGCPNYQQCGQKPINAVARPKDAAAHENGAQRQPGDEEPEGKPLGDDPQQAIGKIKYRLQERIHGKPWQKEILAMVLKAKTLDECVDLETMISDREKAGK